MHLGDWSSKQALQNSPLPRIVGIISETLLWASLKSPSKDSHLGDSKVACSQPLRLGQEGLSTVDSEKSESRVRHLKETEQSFVPSLCFPSLASL